MRLLVFLRKSLYSLRYIPIFFILLYKNFISPVFPASCRFVPSCSTYALEAFKKYGIVKGFYLTIIRLSKCHPFHPGGYDPVE